MNCSAPVGQQPDRKRDDAGHRGQCRPADRQQVGQFDFGRGNGNGQFEAQHGDDAEDGQRRRVDAQVAELVRRVEPREHGGEHDAGGLAQRRAGDHERYVRGEPLAGQP